MPRPQKKRFVCCMPENSSFTPDNHYQSEPVIMMIDEYETIRLIDLENCTQDECAAQMLISRTTVQGIYTNARKKIADSIVNSKRLVISGGDYVVCKCYGKHCGNGYKKRCHKHQCNKNKSEEK